MNRRNFLTGAVAVGLGLKALEGKQPGSSLSDLADDPHTQYLLEDSGLRFLPPDCYIPSAGHATWNSKEERWSCYTDNGWVLI